MKLWKPKKETDFIRLYRNALPADFCNHLIEKFEQDDRKGPGRIADGVRTDVKNSTDLNISWVDGWGDEGQILFDSLCPYLEKYTNEFFPTCRVAVDDPQDYGYQIQRTDTEGFYVWHNDFAAHGGMVRLLTFIWYLNTVKGGETEFLNKKFKPKQGNLLIFPATWTYAHRGLPPAKGLKYICTGWIYTKIFEPPA